ncbi:MAG: hypothetical protein KGP14_08190 [Betaproteobacteria bacterium]|nr:hypothetical protein [Betaproteobacteria bacterium]
MTVTLSAQADWERHSDLRPPMPVYEHHRGGSWVGPVAALAIAGMAIGAAAFSNAYAPPARVW